MFLAHGGTGKETERSDLFRSVRQVGFRADKGPRARKGVAFCFIMQLLAAASTSTLLRRVSGLRIVQLARKVS